MAKIPFDIKYRLQIESGEYKVVDKDNHNIRIICWDKKSEKKYGYYIVGLVEFGPDHEESRYYTVDGKGRLKDKEPELFIVTPEEELSEFEKVVKDRLWRTLEYSETFRKDENKWVQELAAELLSLAREQFIKDGYVIEKKAFHDAVKKVDPEVMKEVSKAADLTWKDINEIERIINKVHYEFPHSIGEEAFGKLVLERFIGGKDDLQEQPKVDDIERE